MRSPRWTSDPFSFGEDQRALADLSTTRIREVHSASLARTRIRSESHLLDGERLRGR